MRQSSKKSKPVIFATVSSVITSLIFIAILALLHFEQWEVYVVFTAVCFALWPLWYWTSFRHLEVSQPESWKGSFVAGSVWAILGVANLSWTLFRHHHDFADSIETFFGSAVLGICQAALALTYLYKGIQLRNSQR